MSWTYFAITWAAAAIWVTGWLAWGLQRIANALERRNKLAERPNVFNLRFLDKDQFEKEIEADRRAR